MANTIKLKRSSTASDTPTASDLEVGELAINTADAKLFTKHTDNSIKEISGTGGDVVDDTSPQLGGDLDTNGNNINFADSAKATFGTDGDLEILYNGFASQIRDVGDGGLVLQTTNGPFIQLSTDFDIMAKFYRNGAVELYHDNTLTTQTSSEGLDVETGILNIKNGGTQSEVRLFCESSNAHYAGLKAPAHADFTGNVTSTLPSVTGTLIGTANADAPATTTSSSDADHVLVNDGGVLKKITPSDLGIGSGGGGSASDSFKTIAVSGQSNVVADSSTDTLTYVAGSNMTITTDASTDTITFASSGSGGGGSSNLAGLSDVTISSVADGDLLRYNGTASEWQNTNLGLTVTPTISLDRTSVPSNASAVVVTVTNHSTLQADDVHYSAAIKRSSDNVVIIGPTSSPSVQYSTSYGQMTGTITFNIAGTVATSANEGNSYYVAVTAQTFGDLQSEVATQTFTIVAPPQVSLTSGSYRYYRLTDFANQVFLYDWQCFSGINQSGTSYPSTNASSQSWSSDGQTNSLTASYQYSSTYADWKTMNSSLSDGWWTLGGSTSSSSSLYFSDMTLTWDAGTARTIKSMEFYFHDRYTNTVPSGDNAFIVQGSNDNSNWTTIATVTASDEDFDATGFVYTTVLLSDTS